MDIVRSWFLFKEFMRWLLLWFCGVWLWMVCLVGLVEWNTLLNDPMRFLSLMYDFRITVAFPEEGIDVGSNYRTGIYSRGRYNFGIRARLRIGFPNHTVRLCYP